MQRSWHVPAWVDASYTYMPNGMLSYCGSHRRALASTVREKQSNHQQDIQTLIEVKE